MLTPPQRAFKRAFDLIFATVALVLIGWLILLVWIIASIDTRSNGIFAQVRVGRGGQPFRMYKIRTMRASAKDPDSGQASAGDGWTAASDRDGYRVTHANDHRVTRVGRFWRNTKLDELPQFVNVWLGQMSLVGPRPAVSEQLAERAEDRAVILSVRPGITGPASLKYQHEEKILAEQSDPAEYHRTVIGPDKIELNKQYVQHWSFTGDLYLIFITLRRIFLGSVGRRVEQMGEEG